MSLPAKQRAAIVLQAKRIPYEITYIDRGLWPAFLCLALKRAEGPTGELSELARRLLTRPPESPQPRKSKRRQT